MSRQQAHVEQLLRSQHDKLVAEIQLRQRNFVFPDTVRNLGVFYRNLAGESIHAYLSHRVFAAIFGIMRMLLNSLVMPVIFIAARSSAEPEVPYLDDSIWTGAWILSIVISLKIAVNATIHENPTKLPLTRIFPRVKI